MALGFGHAAPTNEQSSLRVSADPFADACHHHIRDQRGSGGLRTKFPLADRCKLRSMNAQSMGPAVGMGNQSCIPYESIHAVRKCVEVLVRGLCRMGSGVAYSLEN